MEPNPQFTADLVSFAGEILNGKLHFLCSDWIASIVINVNMQPRKQTTDRIKNIDIIEKPWFEKLEVVMMYKNIT